MKQNELARMAVNALRDIGVADANLANLTDVDNDAPFLQALMGSGLIANGMTGLKLSDKDDLSHSDVDVLIKASRGMHAGDAWIRGDIMLHIKQVKFGGRDIPTAQFEQLAKQFGCSAKRLMNNLTTSSAWSLDERYNSDLLSNTQHEILNQFTGTVRTAWAERAIAESMTVAQLRDAVKLDGASVQVTTDTQGETVAEVGFISDSITPIDAVRHIYRWYETEFAKTGSSRQAFENVMLSFHENGLLNFPLRKWVDVVVSKGE